jgi:hypothetical protein
MTSGGEVEVEVAEVCPRHWVLEHPESVPWLPEEVEVTSQDLTPSVGGSLDAAVVVNLLR